MRTISNALLTSWSEGRKEIVNVIELEFSAGNKIYFTSHDVPGLSGVNVFSRTLSDVGGVSQTIYPEQGRSSIGNYSFSCIDVDGTISTRIKNEDTAGNGLRHRVVREYMGFVGLNWSDFNSANEIVATYMIEDMSVDIMEYRFQCSDIQRQSREQVFMQAKTKLSLNVSATDLLIPVQSVNGSSYSPYPFRTMYHGPTFSDAPGSTVGYIRIRNEIIRYSGTTTDGVKGLCFVVDGASGRGCLNTAAEAHETSGEGLDVVSVVYLEMPAVELAYAMLTGSYYSQPGKFLPDEWHLGIDPAFIRTSEFLNVGRDLWNGSSGGFITRFVGEKEQDGKRFIESQLMHLSSCQLLVRSDGAYGIRRVANVLHKAPYSFLIKESDILSHTEVELKYSNISNSLVVAWNYDFIKEKCTRAKGLLDLQSRLKYKKAPHRRLEFRGLHGSRHSATTIEGLFDRLRDRYAGPSYEMEVELPSWCIHLEVGDVIRLIRTNANDPLYSGGLDRTFEIQSTNINRRTGVVKVKLFGSSVRSSLIMPEQPDSEPSYSVNVIPDADYSAFGTNLATYPGVTISVTGDVGHITGGTGIVGGATRLTGRFYYLGDLQLDAGVILPYFNNVEIWVRGHFQVNGTMDGTGRGQSGASAVVFSANNPKFADTFSEALSAKVSDAQTLTNSFNAGLQGLIGPTVSDGSTNCLLNIATGNRVIPLYSRGHNAGNVTDGLASAVVPYQISYNATTKQVDGLPDVLWGTSGCSGRMAQAKLSSFGYWKIAGGAGGDSGAGLAIVHRGMSFGVSGKIITDGTDGDAGESFMYDTDGAPIASGAYSDTTDRYDTVYAGSGAGGAPGVFISIPDGLNSTTPDLGKVQAKFGVGTLPVVRKTGASAWGPMKLWSGLSDQPESSYAGPTYNTKYRQELRDLSGLNGGAAITIPIPPPTTPVPDEENVPASNPSAISLVEYTNTPPSPAANLSTIEVSVTPPSPIGSYSYSNIYYRKYNSGQGWTYACAASPEGVFVVATDGTQYEVMARAVSTSGEENTSGPTNSIYVSDVINPPASDNDIPKIVKVPDVTGLEISGLGHITQFSGTDATIVWRRSSLAEWIGPIAAARLGSGAQDQYFSHYEILITDSSNGEELHRATTTTPLFVYTLAMNEDDSKRLDAQKLRTYAGVRRSLGVTVRQYSRQGVRSTNDAYMVISNPAPSDITGILVQEGATSAVVTYNRPTDTDFIGVEVFMSTVSGFTPSLVNRILNGPDNALTIYGLTSATNYYLRFRPYDAYGQGNLSSEVGFTTGTIASSDIDGLSAWATQVTPADAAFINANLAADAIESTKIANLSVAKLTAGVLNVTMTIQTTGSINVVNGIYTTKIGVHNVSGTDYAIRTSDGATSTFSVTAAGVLNATGANISGNVTISGGSGYANLTDKPTSLAGINGTEGTKLSGIATGATKNITTSGLFSARPTGADGDFYYATDTFVLYQKISGAWIVAANAYSNTNQLADGAGLGTTATWTGVSGSGKPADNATKNVLTTGTLAARPTGADGDFYYATDNSTLYQKISGAWIVASTVGATWGTNLTGQPADSVIMNSYVSQDLNSITDPTFAKSSLLGGAYHWSGGAQCAINATDGEGSTPALRITANGAINDCSNVQFIPARAGDVFYFYARVFVSADFNGQLQLGTNTFNSAKTDLASYPSLTWSGASLTLGAWADYYGAITVSASTAAFVRARVSVRQTATTGYAIFDNVYFSTVAINATKNLVSSGSLSARPTGADGDFYFATDTFLLYQKISGAWVVSANNYTNTNQLLDGAGLGTTATWTGVSSKPTELTDGRISAGLNSAGALRQIVRGSDLVAGSVATGLNMSSTRLGYYNGSTWPVYIANDGTFYFGSGGAANFIQWNGTTLTINGTLTIQSASGYANLTDRPTSLAGINSTEGTKLTGIATGATKNTVTSGTTAPVSPANGDIWVDTNTPVTIKTRVSGAWVSGGNIPTTLSQVNSSEGSKLSGVAIGATANAVSSGTLATRPTGANGDFYYATDNNILYQKISGAWVQSANNYTNTNQLSDGANLGGTATWTGVSGAGKPADNADVTQAAMNATVTITGGGIVMSAGGSIKGGKTAPGSGVGFFLGYSGGVYQLDVGDTSAGEYIRFNGTNLTLGPKTKLMGASVMEDSDILRLNPKWETNDYVTTLTGNGTAVIQGTMDSSVRLETGSTAAVGTSQIIASTTANHLNAGDWAKRRTLVLRIRAQIKVTTTKAWIGFGAKTASLTNSVVFEITQNSIIARSRGSHTTNVSDTTVSTADNYFGVYYTLKIVMEDGSAYFYLNGTLVATHTSANGVPTGGNNSQNYLFARLEKTDTVAQTERVDIGELKFLQKE